MNGLGLQGAVRGRRFKTTKPDSSGARPMDLVERDFNATRPNELWVSDLTYIATWRGFVYVAFVIDVFARLIVGWRATTSLTAGIALDALEQALHGRRLDPEHPLVHHSDRGVQYVSIRYTERLAEAGIEPSVGSRGDSYDNALAESIIASGQNIRTPSGSAVCTFPKRLLESAIAVGYVFQFSGRSRDGLEDHAWCAGTILQPCEISFRRWVATRWSWKDTFSSPSSDSRNSTRSPTSSLGTL